jgi:predicted lipid-binding transport protein (Tim44 family)
MDIDIIICAVIAILLLARLWKVLGERDEGEARRPNPFIAQPKPKDPSLTPVISGDPNRAAPAALPPPLRAAPNSLAGGFEQIKTLDPAFDEKRFLENARTSFIAIITAFAKGDTAQLVTLVDPVVLTHFQDAIDHRVKAQQTMENKIGKITDADPIAARIDGARAFITVKFTSEQENVLRDAGGQVIGGEPGKVESVTDIWVFSRDTAALDPKWRLAETRE